MLQLWPALLRLLTESWKLQSSFPKWKGCGKFIDIKVHSQRESSPASRDWPCFTTGFPFNISPYEDLILPALAHWFFPPLCAGFSVDWSLYGAYLSFWQVSDQIPHLHGGQVKGKFPWRASWCCAHKCYCLITGILVLVMINGLFWLTRVWFPILSYLTLFSICVLKYCHRSFQKTTEEFM